MRDGEKITIHQGEELVLDGSFDVDESAGSAEFADGWVKNDEYIGYYTAGKPEGKGCAYGINGEKLKDGMWDMGEFATGKYPDIGAISGEEKSETTARSEGNDGVGEQR